MHVTITYRIKWEELYAIVIGPIGNKKLETAVYITMHVKVEYLEIKQLKQLKV